MYGMTWEDLRDYIYVTLKVIDAEQKEAVQGAAILAVQDIGAEANWEFKRSTTPGSVTIDASTNSKRMTDAINIKNITRAYISGRPTLNYYKPEAFRDYFQGTTLAGIPTAYTIRNDTLYVDVTVDSDTIVYYDYFEALGSDFSTLTNNYAHVLLAGVDYYLNLGKDDNVGKLIRFRETKKQMKKNLPMVQDKTEESVHFDSRINAANSHIDNL